MDILEFLDTSYTAFHTVKNVCGILDAHGFAPLTLGERWRLSEGGKYYVTQNGSSVAAFCIGKNKTYNICESHTDSPAFKVKGASVAVNGGVVRLNTEKYGGGLLYSFFDRPLKVCGRLLVETANGAEQRLVASGYDVVIPSLAIHHNPSANESFSVNLQSDALPLFSLSEQDLYKTFTDKKVLDSDLYVVPATPAFYAGVNKEFLCSPRLDNLTSVYASVTALCNASPKDIAVVACLDNEEVGSGTRQGSPDFVDRVLCQIESALSLSVEQAIAARENGAALSVDNGHAAHPAHAEKNDPYIQVKLNGGVVVKHHPNYATDGLSAALFKSVVSDKVPVQDYYNRSDVRCGSTLGLVTSRRLGIKTCDIGLAQLAMHSACETVGADDIDRMQQALTLFLSANISQNGDAVQTK
ncbi:MAG: M18 family aminopeptidase [Corallococcus sp.]|nr:M18 family aminopeptidase [Corallococcus sp.]MCM1359014.1 M18 family aminopeptidase [Corallococcus sp.]MCM1395003.1 M18 family aminopeptidase [Corallococcus sp.]